MRKIEKLWNKYHKWMKWAWLGLAGIGLAYLLFSLIPYPVTERYAGGAAGLMNIQEAKVTIDGTTEEVSLPYKVKNLEPGTRVDVTIQFQNHRDDSYIQVRSAFAPLVVDVDGTNTYSMGTADTRPSFMKDPGTMLRMIPVPETGDVTITLHYTFPNTRSSFTIPSFLISNQSGLLRNMMNKLGSTLAGSFVMLVAGVIVMIMSLLVVQLDQSGVILLWLGAFMGLTGLWGCSNCDMVIFFYNAPNLWYMLSYLSFFSLFLPLELLLEKSVRFHNRKPLYCMRVVLMLFFLGAVFLQACGLVMLSTSTHIFQVLLPASIYFFTIAVVYEAVRYQNRAGMVWSLPMLILSAGCTLELVHYFKSNVYSDSRYFLFSAMAFCIFMSMVGGVQIRKSIQVARREREQEYKLSILGREISEQKKYQDTLLEHEKQLRRLRHDYRHQVTALQEYAKNGDLEGMESYLSRMRESIPAFQETRYTENTVVNAVVSYYVRMAQQEGAEVNINILIPGSLSTSVEQNLCVVFGNLLENAAEAIGRLGEGAEKKVRLSAVMHMGNLVIHMENSMSGTPKKWGRYYVSSKREEVGIGLTSIENIASMYNGDAQFHTEDGKFISDVYFML